MSKANTGNFFEDYSIGQVLPHATPRTITVGDQSLYTALYGSRFALQSSSEFAKGLGFERAPIDDLLAFHVIFGKTVPDISLNAVANLGYAQGRFFRPVFPGDTLRAISEIIGLKENSSGKTGVVYVRTVGQNQRDEIVLSYVRWVMVHKRDQASPAPETVVPELADAISMQEMAIPENVVYANANLAMSGSPHRWGNYEIGERINHLDGMTVEEAEHQLATRLYQNTAKVHFNQHTEGEGRFGRRLVYGGHVISLARALSFNGLGNAFQIAGINGGTHVSPLFAGDTVYAWSEVLDKAEIEGRPGMGALRLRLVALKNQAPAEFPHKDADGKYDPSVILDFDYWVLMPR